MVHEIPDGSNLADEDAGLPFATLRVKRRAATKAKAKKEVRP